MGGKRGVLGWMGGVVLEEVEGEAKDNGVVDMRMVFVVSLLPTHPPSIKLHAH